LFPYAIRFFFRYVITEAIRVRAVNHIRHDVGRFLICGIPQGDQIPRKLRIIAVGAEKLFKKTHAVSFRHV
jgi:hypothetical protein